MEQLAASLAGRLGLEPSLARGLLVGIETLFDYAQAEYLESSCALDEERQGVAVARQAVRPIFQARMQRRLAAVDAEQRAVKCLGCGQLCEGQGGRERTWRSTLGELNLTRFYGWCWRCGQGRALGEEKVGLPATDYTASLEEVCSLMAATVPHGMAVKTVKQLLGLRISEKGIKQVVARRGEQVVAETDREAKELKQFEEKWARRPKIGPAPASRPPIEIAYLEMDGVIVPIRESVEPEPEVTRRGGKGRKYSLNGREVKNAVLYVAEACAQESESRHCLLEKSYVSHAGDWKQFALLVWAALLKRGFDRAKLIINTSADSTAVSSPHLAPATGFARATICTSPGQPGRGKAGSPAPSAIKLAGRD